MCQIPRLDERGPVRRPPATVPVAHALPQVAAGEVGGGVDLQPRPDHRGGQPHPDDGEPRRVDRQDAQAGAPRSVRRQRPADQPGAREEQDVQAPLPRPAPGDLRQRDTGECPRADATRPGRGQRPLDAEQQPRDPCLDRHERDAADVALEHEPVERRGDGGGQRADDRQPQRTRQHVRPGGDEQQLDDQKRVHRPAELEHGERCHGGQVAPAGQGVTGGRHAAEHRRVPLRDVPGCELPAEPAEPRDELGGDVHADQHAASVHPDVDGDHDRGQAGQGHGVTAVVEQPRRSAT